MSDQTTTADAVRAVLEKARAYLATPNQRCRGVAALDAHGNEVDAESLLAVKRSAYGALDASGAPGVIVRHAQRVFAMAAQKRHRMSGVEADAKLDDAALLAVLDEAMEMAQPSKPAETAPPPPASASTKATTTAVAVTDAKRLLTEPALFRDVKAMTAHIEALREVANVCVPVTRPDFIRPFCEVGLRVIALDTTRLPREPVRKPGESADFYFEKQARGWAHSKIGLAKIATALGVSWHPLHHCRVDDESDPLYCRFRAVGCYVGFDGTEHVITKHKSVDYRKGSPQIVGMTDLQLGQARRFIGEHAESKAMNRVIREVAFLKSAYTEEELKRPFVVLACVLTGYHEDPEMRRMFAEKMADHALRAESRLFGSVAASATAQLGPAGTIPDLGIRTAPPPVGTEHADDADPYDGPIVEGEAV